MVKGEQVENAARAMAKNMHERSPDLFPFPTWEGVPEETKNRVRESAIMALASVGQPVEETIETLRRNGIVVAPAEGRRLAMAKAIGFAGRHHLDESADEEEFWTFSAPVSREAYLKMADGAIAFERRAAVSASLSGARPIWECAGCGHVTRNPLGDIETLRDAGARACCPERKMRPLAIPASEAARWLAAACVRVTRDTEGRTMTARERRIYDLGSQAFETLLAIADENET